jgi:hypothetical protein
MLPLVWEAADLQNPQQTKPIHRVERLCKIQLDHQGWCTALVTALDKFSGEHAILRNRSPLDEVSLINVDQLVDLLLKAGGEQLG